MGLGQAEAEKSMRNFNFRKRGLGDLAEPTVKADYWVKSSAWRPRAMNGSLLTILIGSANVSS